MKSLLRTSALHSGLLLAMVFSPLALNAQITDRVDWEKFLAREDMLWKSLPGRFEAAAFTGNGQLGAMIFTGDTGQSLKWQMGRSDVVFNKMRIPIGDLVLQPAGKILQGEMRLDLWNAEARGSLKTDKGEIRFHAFTHSDLMVNVFEVTTSGGEKPAWSWQPGIAANPDRKSTRLNTSH